MGQNFDPLGDLSPEDRAYLARQRAAKERQMAAWKAGEGPEPTEEGLVAVDDEGLPVAPSPAIDVSANAPGMIVPEPKPPPRQMLAVFRAEPVEKGLKELPPAAKQYAPDWKELKNRLKPHDGLWMVERCDLPLDMAQILGFFGMPGWDMPEGAKKESFEVIVKDGRVFRTDPD